ncbi:MAG: glycerol-3-phosphate 1-O-acyltransferase PlsY [Phycisphaerales bacterium]|nr:glycerol-3-phosphate 1-O-acyltransferase PlsY [Phycisphaerales bacterium]
MTTTAVILIIAAYLVGSIPFGLLIGRARGIDIRKLGSGNIGATNAGRVLGRKWGMLCLALDILKGLAPTLIAGWIVVDRPLTASGLLAWSAVGLAAVLGHNFSIFLGFRGGKGVATTIGAASAVWPYYTVAMAIALLAYAAFRFGTRFVSLGSLAMAAAFPLAVLGLNAAWTRVPLDAFWPLPTIAVALGLMIVVRHHENISRLVRGAEARIDDPIAPATKNSKAIPPTADRSPKAPESSEQHLKHGQ